MEAGLVFEPKELVFQRNQPCTKTISIRNVYDSSVAYRFFPDSFHGLSFGGQDTLNKLYLCTNDSYELIVHYTPSQSNRNEPTTINVEIFAPIVRKFQIPVKLVDEPTSGPIRSLEDAFESFNPPPFPSYDGDSYFVKVKKPENNLVGNVLKLKKTLPLSPIECEICCETYDSEDRTPRILNGCGHSVCQRCAGKLISDKEIKCPTCREKTEVKNDVTSLLKNFEVLKIVNAQKSVEGKDDYPNCPNHSWEIAKLHCTSPDCTTTDKVMCYQCIDEDGKHEGHSSEPIRRWMARHGIYPSITLKPKTDQIYLRHSGIPLVFDPSPSIEYHMVPISSNGTLRMAVSITPKQLIFEKNKESLQHLRIDCHSSTIFRATSNAPNILKFKGKNESFGKPLTATELYVLAVNYTPSDNADTDNVRVVIEVKTGKFEIPVKFVESVAETTEKSEKSIDCEICYETFNSEDRIPRILNSCGHTLCQTCAKKMIKNYEITCAVCREVTGVRDDVTSLLKNFEILKLLDAPSNSAVVQPSEIEPESRETVVKLDEAPKCPNHSKEVARYFCTSPDCTTTDKVMCYQCIDEDGKHEGHSSEPIRKWMKRQQLEKCKKLLDDLHQKELNLKWKIGKSKRDEEKFHEKGKSEHEKIVKKFSEKSRELVELEKEATRRIMEYAGFIRCQRRRKPVQLEYKLEAVRDVKWSIENFLLKAGKSITTEESGESIAKLADALETLGIEDDSSDDKLPEELFTLTDDMELIINH